MDVSARFGRLGFVSLVGLSILSFVSCAGSLGSFGFSSAASTPSSAEPSALNEGALAQGSIGSAPVTPALPTETEIHSSSRILMNTDRDPLGLEIIDTQSANQIVLDTKRPITQGGYNVSRLSAPPRLVVDVMGGNEKIKSKSFDTADAEYVSKVRVGAHPGMSRIVFDLPEGQPIQHRVDSRDGRLFVTLSGDTMSAATQEALLANAAAMPKEAIFTGGSDVASTVAAANDSTSAATESVDRLDRALSDLSAPGDAGSRSGPAEITSLTLEPLGAGSNMLVVDTAKLGAYSLKKTAPSEYVLRVENANFDRSAIGLAVAPPNSGAIRSVRPIAQGSDVLLRIFASPDAKLAARGGESKIVVSAAQDIMSDHIRAQAGPEKPTLADPNATKAEIEKQTGKPAADDSFAKPAGADDQGTIKISESNGSAESITSSLLDDGPKYTGRLISLDLQDADIDNALRIIAEVSNLNIIASDDVTGKVTLRLIDVPWDQALDVILKTNGLDKVQEGNVIRIAPVEKLRQEREALKQLKITAEELEPLQVKYVRISYAKASELKALVETVISERGTVAYDERSNQIIVKDIGSGIKNVSELVSKVDLRTPQVLLETQIVEATRSLLRDLGSEVGFEYIQSAATGNPTGMNFPNSINIGGSAVPGNADSTVGSSFPAGISASAGSAVSFLLGSADGSKSLETRISALEQEGRVRVVSRPAVATTNNKQAVIKSVEKIRVKTPQGGLSVATGQGATAAGSSAVATEVIEIGITLEVTPQASPDYYVLLDINAKSSTFGTHPVDGIPSEVERSATSTVLVSSGQTFAMGGIYKISDVDNLAGVPFLKDIPFFGHLFRHSLVNNGDEELLFFITPRIVEGSFDDATMKVSA